MYSSTIISFLTLAGLVSAHGYPKGVKIDGKQYPGATGAAADLQNSPIRPINNGVDNGAPIDDVNSPNMACGINAKAASVVASANPGSQIDVMWQGPTGIPWFHAAGPIMTYMAKCTGDCTTFTPSASTNWFKIVELGESTVGDPSTWYQAKLPAGAPVSIKLPADLAGGNYLLRQEIIATQNSMFEGKTEFYPACIQLKVNGPSGPDPSPTVHFPGAYSAQDAGILGNFYNPGVPYVFPGGALANVAGGAASSPAPAAPKPAPANSKPAPAASKPAPAVSVYTPPVNAAPEPVTSGSGSSTHSCGGSKKMHRKRRLSSH